MYFHSQRVTWQCMVNPTPTGPPPYRDVLCRLAVLPWLTIIDVGVDVYHRHNMSAQEGCTVRDLMPLPEDVLAHYQMRLSVKA